MSDREKRDKLSIVGAFLTEAIGWLQIMASPLLIGLAIGAYIYFDSPSPIRLVLGSLLATVGFLVGVIWATRVWKRTGTVRFLSRIMETPELDELKDANATKGGTGDQYRSSAYEDPRTHE